MAKTKTRKQHQAKPRNEDLSYEALLLRGNRLSELGELVSTVSSILTEGEEVGEAQELLDAVATAIGSHTGISSVTINALPSHCPSHSVAQYRSDTKSVGRSSCVGDVVVRFDASHVPSAGWNATHAAIGALVSQFQRRLQAESALSCQVSFATVLRDVFETLASTRASDVGSVLAASLEKLGIHLGADSLAIWMQRESTGVVERIMRWHLDGSVMDVSSFFASMGGTASPARSLPKVDLKAIDVTDRQPFTAGVEEVHSDFVEAQRDSGVIDAPDDVDGIRLWAVPMVHSVRLGALVVGFADGRDLTEWERAGLRSFVSQIPALQVRTAAESQLRTALEAAPVGVVVRNARGVIVECNTAYCDLVGLADKSEAIGSAGATDVVNCETADDDTVQPGNEDLVQLTHTCGRVVWARVSSATVAVGGHDLTWTYYEDVTKEREAHAVLSQHAYFDQLTGLPNRHGFANLISTLPVTESHPDEKAQAALLMIDLNEFKMVNDTHGHQVGDAVLQEASARIQNAVRSSDRAVRYGGDEFVVLLSGPILLEHAMRVADNIHSAFEEAIDVDEVHLDVGLSVGITLVTDELSVEFPDALARADRAMYEVKASGEPGTVVNL